MRQRFPGRLPPARPRYLSLGDLLPVLDHSRGSRIELVCWRLDKEEREVLPAWNLALRERLIEPRGEDPFTGQPMYGLTVRGEAALRRLRAGRRGDR